MSPFQLIRQRGRHIMVQPGSCLSIGSNEFVSDTGRPPIPCLATGIATMLCSMVRFSQFPSEFLFLASCIRDKYDLKAVLLVTTRKLGSMRWDHLTYWFRNSRNSLKRSVASNFSVSFFSNLFSDKQFTYVLPSFLFATKNVTELCLK